MTSRTTAKSKRTLPNTCQKRSCNLLPTTTQTPSLLGSASHEELGRGQDDRDNGHRVSDRRRVAPIELPEADLVQVDRKRERRVRRPTRGEQERYLEDLVREDRRLHDDEQDHRPQERERHPPEGLQPARPVHRRRLKYLLRYVLQPRQKVQRVDAEVSPDRDEDYRQERHPLVVQPVERRQPQRRERVVQEAEVVVEDQVEHQRYDHERGYERQEEYDAIEALEGGRRHHERADRHRHEQGQRAQDKDAGRGVHGRVLQRLEVTRVLQQPRVVVEAGEGVAPEARGLVEAQAERGEHGGEQNGIGRGGRG